MAKKIPLRKCVGCDVRKTKKELIRVVRNKEGEISLDTTGKANGKGAYLCPNSECFEKAYKKDLLSRAFKEKVSNEIYEALLEEIKKYEE
ncbi:MAG: YlxR family protein [Tissierellales bacterium]|jgi:predicted RNA-binding protein YlxR (DUF448 family)|nr:YlxR family protein [Tissierellales bacterium]